jgi:acyl-CoA dehydrogenase
VDFELSEKSRSYLQRLGAFMDEEIYPNEERFYEQQREGDRWQEPPLLDELKGRARTAGLWNLFLPDSRHGAGLSNLDYAPLCELMGRVKWAPGVQLRRTRTGNMETLERYSTAGKREWLEPLLTGEIRSAFAMTEPRVASSDATNIGSSCRDGDAYVITGASGGPRAP